MLHGRERELQVLRARLDEARRGRSFAVVLSGEAGIGKTALLRQIIADAEGFRVLRGRGFESETEIPYAGLLALVRPLLPLAEALPEQQAAALRSALALGPPTPHDRFAVPVALLALLAAAAEDQPLLVAVDDAHWLDPATREALFFAARRLDAEGVGVLITAREGDGQPLVDVAGLERLAVGGLDIAGARSLLAGEVAQSVADALTRATGGNPLALLELPPVLSDEERRGLRPIRTPLPTGARVEELFSRRVEELPVRTRRALGVAAAIDGGALDQLFAALERVGLTDEDLAPAESAAVVAVRGTRLVFRHPLVRSAAYQGQSLADRRAAHAALADVATDARQRAWHRAQAATGPDEDVAAALEAAAVDAAQRGGQAEAALTFARAAELSPEPATAGRRLVAAAASAMQVGNLDQAFTLLDAAEQTDLAPDMATEARRMRGLLLIRTGRLDEGNELLESEAARLADTDPALAADTLLIATPMYMYTGHNADMLDFGQRARALVGDSDAEIAELADVVIAMALSAQGLLTPQTSPLLQSRVHDPAGRQPAEITMGCTHGLMFLELYDLTAERVEAHVEEAREAGAALRLIYPLALRAELGHRTGRWASAKADVEESMRLVEETAYDIVLAGHPTAIAALVALDTGDRDRAHELVERAHAIAAKAGANTVMLWTHWVRGRLALLDGDAARAADELLSVPRIRQETGWGESNIVLADGDLGEALAEAGRLDEARAQEQRMREEAARLDRRYQLMAAERIAALLADDDAFEPHFDAARVALGPLPLAFEHARTNLLLGTRRLRAGRLEDAREPLQRAVDVFERLGAAPWLARTREQLHRAGATTVAPTAGSGAATAAGVLTAQEWRVAQLVAGGLTNREVAASLFLSPKTIEHHLSTIYRKLGVRSRTQLARLFGEELQPSAA